MIHQLDVDHRERFVSMGREGVRQKARVDKRDKRARFTSLLHHVTPWLLVEGFYAPKKDAASGVGEVTWREYEGQLYGRVQSAAFTKGVYIEGGWQHVRSRIRRFVNGGDRSPPETTWSRGEVRYTPFKTRGEIVRQAWARVCRTNVLQTSFPPKKTLTDYLRA